ncbi:hypothetical protein M569_08465 [Genlisea aurea]|uniref:ATP synthase subunit O, mitochondrial n=1 Tax=Genlisea aurea TaxID=192259 RepID=S8DSY8_9LAMI|nr:hypothetical protein M569_08465 [Genlisea aurea]
MAISWRLRSGLSVLRRSFTAGNAPAVERGLAPRALLCSSVSTPAFARNFASSPPEKELKVKVPIKLFGMSGNYASALYIAAVKANSLDKVESEVRTLVEAAKQSPTFSQFMKDLSVSADTRSNAIQDICSQAGFSDITRNFLVIAAENGRLRFLERISERFSELSMAHRGEVKAIVTTVIPLPLEEEKELKETLEDILGEGKKVILEQKIDPSILGGLVVEFSQKVFDISIKTRAAQMERFLRQPINLDGF